MKQQKDGVNKNGNSKGRSEEDLEEGHAVEESHDWYLKGFEDVD